MITPEQFAPPDLNAASLVVLNYAKENGLTPKNVIDVFHAGLLAQNEATRTFSGEAPSVTILHSEERLALANEQG